MTSEPDAPAPPIETSAESATTVEELAQELADEVHITPAEPPTQEPTNVQSTVTTMREPSPTPWDGPFTPEEADLPSPTEETAISTDPAQESPQQKDDSGKRVPYVNPERVKTGGAQRVKPTDEELTEIMARMREKNAKIRARQEDIKADEEAFSRTQQVERVKAQQRRDEQTKVDGPRVQNMRRKMEQIQTREWDSKKPWSDGPSTNRFQRGRGGPRGRGRGGGRGSWQDIDNPPDGTTTSAA